MTGKLRILLIIFIIALFTSGCSIIYPSKSRKSERAMAMQEREWTRSYDDGYRRHWSGQSERTMDMVKETRTKSKKINRQKKESWIRRFLGL